MEIKNKIFDSEKFIEAINTINDFTGFDVRTSLKLYNLFKKLQEHNDSFRSQKAKLVKKYGKEVEDGTAYEIEKDKIPQFTKEFETLLEISVEVDLPEKFKFPDVEINLAPSHIFILESIFDFTELEK